MFRWQRLLSAVCLLWMAGCATHADHLRLIRSQYYTGDLEGATQTISGRLERDGHDVDVLKLDQAVVDLISGRPEASEQTLREIRDRFDHLEQKSIGESALSFLTDDQREAYAGEDYEKILIRAFLALSNLMGDGNDAVAYSLQVIAKQDEIIQAGAQDDGENPKLAYKRVALGAYIHALIREATHSNYDDVERSIQLVVDWEPEFRFGQNALERARHGRHSEPGNGVLYVFTLVGRGPYKKEVMEIPTTAALLIADRILSMTSKYSLPPTVAPIRVPKVFVPKNSIQSVNVAVDGQPQGTTATITDVGELAVRQYEAIFPQVMAKAIVRRIVKKGVIYASKEVIGGAENPFVNLAFDAVGVAWEAAENADTRCWGLLPEKIQILRLELPAGQHRISLQPHTEFGTLGRKFETVVQIEDGRNSFVLANFPDTHLVGEILTSEP